MRDPTAPSPTPSDAPAAGLGIGLQLYTLRTLSDDLATLARHAAAAGFAAVETFGPTPADPARLAEELAAAGVRVCSCHVALGELEADPGAVCRAQRTLGNDVLVVPWLAPDQRGRGADGWRALGRRFAELGRRCSDHGARLLYHNHDFELEGADGSTGLGWLLDAAPAEDLGLEPDLGWLARAGADPVGWLERYAGRCPRAHLKDLAAPPERLGVDPLEDGWADVGHGVLDFEALLRACRAAGVEVGVVEHDAPADPLRSAARSAAWIRSRA